MGIATTIREVAESAASISGNADGSRASADDLAGMASDLEKMVAGFNR
jgi:methyl-accepting chemotaxis protein